MSETISELRCIACGQRKDVKTRQFRCDACGDLLAVEHDLERLAARLGPNPRASFDLRRAEMQLPYASGVWRYHELILPDLPKEAIVSLPEGNTPLYRRGAIERFVGTEQVYVKHEGENPTLSFKDRGMTAGVSWAVHAGAKRVACASTGDTSAAMAAYAAAAELSGVVLLPHEKVSAEQLAQPISYGARVLALDTDFDGCMKLVQELTASGAIYLLNSMNPFRIEGQKAIGIETVHQLGWQVPDWFVIPVGNAGNISALGKGLRELHALGLIDRLPRIAGAQAQLADPFYLSYREDFAQRHSLTAGPTIASAIRIGDPVSYEKARAAVQELHGVVTEVSDEEAMEAKAVSDAAGVHICPNSGVALAGARRLREEGVIGAKERVVVIATAHGGKFASTTLPYHTERQGPLANPPQVMEASLQGIEEALG
ncbi:MAG: threonine synthase [Deltaproteobacteria bacterium]|nr:threonine synthase [Deltaproteobacteria bacterium]